MGCEQSSQENFQQSKNSKQLDQQIRQTGKEWKSELKILLLGIGESGKSTIAKQMRILYLNGFPDSEKKQFIPIIHANILSSMKILCLAVVHLELQDKVQEENKGILESYQGIDAYRTTITEAHAQEIKQLWADPAIGEAYQRQSEYFLPGCCAYFFESLDRIKEADFIPNLDDILRCRVKTTSVIETVFCHEMTRFRMVDVGGQRSERRKWIHCFQDVSALLYVVAISEYDQFLMEDTRVNRMVESMELFEELVNSIWFRDIAVIFFLNKIDIFKEKIKKVPLSKYFPEYDGGDDYEKGIAFMMDQYRVLNKIEGRSIFGHPTCATNTENIRLVFEAVRDTLMQKAVQNFVF